MFFLLLLLSSVFSVPPPEEILTLTSIIPALLLLVALFGIGYRDTWVFDGENGRIRQISGVFVFVRRRTYTLDRASHFEISHFTRGYRTEKVSRGDRMRNRCHDGLRPDSDRWYTDCHRYPE